MYNPTVPAKLSNSFTVKFYRAGQRVHQEVSDLITSTSQINMSREPTKNKVSATLPQLITVIFEDDINNVATVALKDLWSTGFDMDIEVLQGGLVPITCFRFSGCVVENICHSGFNSEPAQESRENVLVPDGSYDVEQLSTTEAGPRRVYSGNGLRVATSTKSATGFLKQSKYVDISYTSLTEDETP